jgi:hypothetical protein
MERGRGPPRLTSGFQALRPGASYHKSFCLGHVLVQAMPVPNLFLHSNKNALGHAAGRSKRDTTPKSMTNTPHLRAISLPKKTSYFGDRVSLLRFIRSLATLVSRGPNQRQMGLTFSAA